MKHLIAILFLIPTLAFGAYTEWYCQNGGSNLNAGSTNSNTAAYTSTNGNWTSATRIFVPTDGSTPASSIAVGDYVSIYLDAATQGVFVARVTAVAAGVNGAITVDATAQAGTAPTTGATGRTLKAGGAWKGPNGANPLPFNTYSFLNLKNVAGNYPRINLKNDQTYSITVALALTGTNTTLQGYTTTVGDGGRATIDAGTTAIALMSSSSGFQTFIDLIFANGSTSNNGTIGYSSSNSGQTLYRCVAHGHGGKGISFGNSSCVAIECEVYDTCKNNGSGCGGINLSSSNTSAYYSISHDNAGSNVSGFVVASGIDFPLIQQCIADTNGKYGIAFLGTVSGTGQISQCDIYNNGSDGINFADATTDTRIVIRNTNFIKNGGWGVNTAITTGHLIGLMDNCGFGSGTMANTSGTTNNTENLQINGNITYAANAIPWLDAPNGDFRINLAAANWAGRGAFTETAASYTGTVGFPDIGAAQSKTGAGGTFSKEVSYGYAY